MTLLQQVVLVRVLGISTATDALATALAWSASASGVIGTTLISVVVPIYGRHVHSDPALARQYLGSASGIGFAAAVALVAGTLALAEPLALMLLPGGASQDVGRLTGLLRLTAPLAGLWVLVALVTAQANSRERFAAAALAPALGPIAVVVSLLLPPAPAVEIVGVGYVIGASLQLGALLLSVRPWVRDLLPDRARISPIVRRSAFLAIAFTSTSVGAVVVRAIASLEGAGAVTTLDYASRLVLAAEQVTLAAGLAVAFTAWSLDSGDEGMRLPVGRGLNLAIGFSIPVAVLLGLLAPDIVAVLFLGGRFDQADADGVAVFIRLLVPGMAAHSVLMFGLRGLLARDRSRAVAAALGTHLVLLVALGLPAQALGGLPGIGAALSASWLGALVVLIVALDQRRETQTDGAAFEVARTSVAAGFAALLAFVVMSLMESAGIVRLILGGVSFSMAGLALGYLLRVAFVDAVVARLRSPLARLT